MSKLDDSYEMLDLGTEPTKKPVRRIILAVLLVGAFVGGLLWWQFNKTTTVNTAGPINNSAPVQSQPQPTQAPISTVKEIILFDEASAAIRADQVIKLQRFYSSIAKASGTINVDGYTDDLGSEQDGLVLSQARAALVAETLKALSNNSANYKFNIKGFGENNPVGDNRTEAGRAQNRRVEITFIPSP